MTTISSAEAIKRIREKVDAFRKELNNEDFSTEWADNDIEQLEELDGLRSSLSALQALAEDICCDIGYPLDYDKTED